ncbi:hypothetical protein TcWFU_006112 [Taenia crassiceps]|uniref:Uncharacterized protein n=1 Tax=Taenia crassiceps TaxID=6207 RepID=A0ABR4QA09_9CEST
MVAGLLALIRSGDAYVFESPPSLCIIFNPIELLNNVVKKVGNVDEFGAYGVDLLRAKTLFEASLQDILRCGLRPIPVFGGIPGNGLVTNCLRDLGLHCVQSKYDSMPLCLGIAYCLDCPIASMSSQYYVVSRPTILPEEIQSIAVHELKLVDLTTDFYRVDKEDGKAILKLRVYHPEISAIRNVPAASRPLIALLMDTDLLSRLPAEIKFEPSGSESYSLAKLRAVIDWVAGTNPIHVLQKVMESVTELKCMDYISSNIMLYLGKFCPDFVEASKVLALLGLDKGIVSVGAPKRRIDKKEQQRQKPSSPMFFFETAAGLLKGAGLVNSPVDFLYRWPTALVHLYHFHMLQKQNLTLCALLSYNGSGGSKWPYLQTGGSTSPSNRNMLRGAFPFQSVHDRGLDSALEVPDWSIALVLSCVLWHQQNAEHQDCAIGECPLILSALVLAVVTHYNVECSKLTAAAVVEHYEDLKALVVKRMAESGASTSVGVEKKLMHSALELMVMYDHYVSLCRLLTALEEGDGIPDFSSAAYNRFPPNYEVFPSLALLVSMAAHLRCEETPSCVAVRQWVVNAFLRTANDAEDVVRLRNVVAVFSTVLKCVSEVKLNFTTPEVDVTDPPLCFLPKEERSRARSYIRGRNSEVLLNPGDSGADAQMRDGKQRTSLKRSATYNEQARKGRSYAGRLTERVERMRLN